MVKKLGIGCGTLLLLVIVVGVLASGRAPTTVTPGGGGSPTTTSAPQQAKVGDKVSSGNWEYTVTKVEYPKTVTWSAFGNKTDAKGTWAVIYITLKNIGNRNFGIGPTDFQLTESGGVRYDADIFTGLSVADFQKLSKLSSGEQYPPGVEVKTLMLFEINPAATGLKLVLRQANDTTIDLGK